VVREQKSPIRAYFAMLRSSGKKILEPDLDPDAHLDVIAFY